MIRDRWTVLFLRGEANPVRQYSLPLRAVRPVLVGAGILAVLLVTATVFLVHDSGARARASLLARENRLLEQELQDLQARVGDFETELADLAERDRRARACSRADRESIRTCLRWGWAVPDWQTRERENCGPSIRRPRSWPTRARYDLDVLERRTDLLAKSFAETEVLMAGPVGPHGGDALRSFRSVVFSRAHSAPAGFTPSTMCGCLTRAWTSAPSSAHRSSPPGPAW